MIFLPVLFLVIQYIILFTDDEDNRLCWIPFFPYIALIAVPFYYAGKVFIEMFTYVCVLKEFLQKTFSKNDTNASES